MISAKMTASRLRRDFSPGNDLPLLVAEAVSDAAYREQVLGLLRIHLDLLPQVANVDVDGARIAVRRVAPHTCEQHVAREDTPRGTRQREEDLELDVRGRHDLALARGRALARVDAQALDVDRTFVVRVVSGHPRAPQRGLHA